MEIELEELNGIKLINPKIFKDDRGYFYESFSKKKFMEIGIHDEFVQDNESKSSHGVVRGLHFQIWPGGQSKLLRCIKGRIRDVVVDIRPSSETFKQWRAFDLSEDNKKMLYIPNGFAHGFEVVSEEATVNYKVSSYYDAELEKGIAWDDKEIGVQWSVENPIVSERDQRAPNLQSFLADL